MVTYDSLPDSMLLLFTQRLPESGEERGEETKAFGSYAFTLGIVPITLLALTFIVELAMLNCHVTAINSAHRRADGPPLLRPRQTMAKRA
jgi:hypothetical protein